MIKQFGANSTTDEVLSGLDLTGKRVLITGTSAGIGVETARALVAHGADVIGAVRDIPKAERATTTVRDAARVSGGSFQLLHLDLASLSSVRACADELVAEGRPIDIVIANAGVGVPPFGKTEDGFETQFGVNHLGHFVLVNRLVPILGNGARVVLLSSVAHRFADADFSDPNFEKTAYDPMVAYARSKTANMLFAVEFDKRHAAMGMRAVGVNPGGVETELERHMSPEQQKAGREAVKAAMAEAGVLDYQYKTVDRGAATSIWAAVVADGDAVGGLYCEDCHVAQVSDKPGLEGVSAYALDPALAKSLWTQSEKLVGESFPA